MSIADKRAEMKRAVRYRSGSDMMNTVYLGGMATAGIMNRLGVRYGGDKSLQQAIDDASDSQLLEAHNYQGYQWILGHYIKAGRKLYDYKTVAVEVD